MNVFIVHAHPEPQSFNAALTNRARQTLESEGHFVRVSDLYAMRFDPVSDRRNFTTVKDADYFKQQVEEKHAAKVGGFAPDVAVEMEKLSWCDALILQFPLWWFSMPAVLKGWVDRVFALGYAYGGRRWYDDGVFAGKRAMVSLTLAGDEIIYSKTGLNGDIHDILFTINHGILRFTGFDVLPPFIAWAVARVDDRARRAYLDAYEQRLRTLAETDPIEFRSLDEYDESFRLKDPSTA